MMDRETLAALLAPPFWLVWSPEGVGPPRARHTSREQAEAEAGRLADLNPGREFYVVEPIFRVVSQRRLTQRFSSYDDGIPF